MEKYWLKSYPEGVPQEIHPEQYRSLTQLLEEVFKGEEPFAHFFFHALGVFVGVGVFHVTARVMVVDAGYRLSKLEQHNRALIRDGTVGNLLNATPGLTVDGNGVNPTPTMTFSAVAKLPARTPSTRKPMPRLSSPRSG